MCLKACACHVFAINGTTSDEMSREVNEAYASAGDDLPASDRSDKRRERLETLVESCRVSPGTEEKVKIYGGFRRKQKTPEHMWIEYDGYIYDTMPGHGICRVEATAATRACPGLEGEPFDESGVVCVEATMTEAQKANIASLDP